MCTVLSLAFPIYQRPTAASRRQSAPGPRWVSTLERFEYCHNASEPHELTKRGVGVHGGRQQRGRRVFAYCSQVLHGKCGKCGTRQPRLIPCISHRLLSLSRTPLKEWYCRCTSTCGPRTSRGSHAASAYPTRYAPLLCSNTFDQGVGSAPHAPTRDGGLHGLTAWNRLIVKAGGGSMAWRVPHSRGRSEGGIKARVATAGGAPTGHKGSKLPSDLSLLSSCD